VLFTSDAKVIEQNDVSSKHKFSLLVLELKYLGTYISSLSVISPQGFREGFEKSCQLLQLK
jgi:hypothetical protein